MILNLREENQDELEEMKNKQREERNKYLKEKFDAMDKKKNNVLINKKRDRDRQIDYNADK